MDKELVVGLECEFALLLVVVLQQERQLEIRFQKRVWWSLLRGFVQWENTRQTLEYFFELHSPLVLHATRGADQLLERLQQNHKLLHRCGLVHATLVVTDVFCHFGEQEVHGGLWLPILEPFAIHRCEEQVCELGVVAFEHFSLPLDDPLATRALHAHDADAVVQLEQNFLFKRLLAPLFQLLVQGFRHHKKLAQEILVIRGISVLQKRLKHLAEVLCVPVEG